MLAPRPYILRVSSRARRARLSVSPAEGLVVVVPRGFGRSRADKLVADSAEWIDRALERVAGHAAHLAATRALPDLVGLLATGERFEVRYATGRRSVREAAGELTVLGEDEASHALALHAWLRDVAAARLVPMLDELSRAHGLPYSAARIRSQRTRWASMTRRGSVSLNRSLLFLPEDLARYVMLHELVHGVHFDHSASFWRAMEERDPSARAKARRMREAWRYVPAWSLPPREVGPLLPPPG